MTFEKNLKDWLDKSLQEKIPEEVKALNFNLYEPAGIDDIKFGIELIGSSNFDEKNSDWACEECWEPTQRQLVIPISCSSDDWRTCQEVITEYLARYINSEFQKSKIKNQIIAIGVGFVDGDLDVIYKK